MCVGGGVGVWCFVVLRTWNGKCIDYVLFYIYWYEVCVCDRGVWDSSITCSLCLHPYLVTCAKGEEKGKRGIPVFFFFFF